MKNFDLENEHGRSMIEMLGVLAIIGVLSVGGIAGYSKAMQKYKINKTIEQITLIAGNVRAFFGPQKNYVGACCSTDVNGSCPDNGCSGSSGNIISTWGVESLVENGCPIIKKAKILPDEMITVTNGKIMSITNPFGYGVELSTANKAKSGDNQAFQLIYGVDGSNLDVCLELASHDWSVAGVKAIWAFDPGPMKGGKITVPGDMDKAFDVCDMDKAFDVCSKAYSNGARYIALTFYFDVNSNCWDETNQYSPNTCS